MTTIKKIAAVLSVMVLFAGKSFAGNVKPLIVVGEEPTAEYMTVNFLGEDANYVYFHVALKKGNNSSISFEVADKEEGELFHAVYTSDKAQTLKIEKRNNQQLEFNVKAGKKTFTKAITVVPAVVLDKN